MHFIQWAIDPWGQRVPIHIAWDLIWVAVIASLAFLIGHAIWVHFSRPEEFAGTTLAPGARASIPAKIPRHSLTARLFHWVMAVAMLVLLFTAFLPKVGVRFNWVTLHWIAGLVLIGSIVFHIIHSSFFQMFGSIWPDKTDITDAVNRARRMLGRAGPLPRRFAKYPFENKMYHLAVVITALTVAFTGAFMIFRVGTPFLTRDPYLFFGFMGWGVVYVLHGLAGVTLIALVAGHIYFAVRPEKLNMTKSMIFGWISRDHFLEHHDPERWVVTESTSAAPSQGD